VLAACGGSGPGPAPPVTEAPRQTPATPAPVAVEVAVEDEGHGIDPALIERIFEPFFTTKPPGQGTGLGLSVVYSIIEEHGGTVAASNRPTGGTRFELRLPAGATDDAQPKEESAA